MINLCCSSHPLAVLCYDSLSELIQAKLKYKLLFKKEKEWEAYSIHGSIAILNCVQAHSTSLLTGFSLGVILLLLILALLSELQAFHSGLWIILFFSFLIRHGPFFAIDELSQSAFFRDLVDQRPLFISAIFNPSM